MLFSTNHLGPSVYPLDANLHQVALQVEAGAGITAKIPRAPQVELDEGLTEGSKADRKPHIMLQIVDRIASSCRLRKQ